MGCNCGKSSRQPAGLRPAPAPPPPKPPPVRKQSGATQTFALTTPDRAVRSFGSRLEAEAARVRSGGVGTITPSG